jgi:xylulokinase
VIDGYSNVSGIVSTSGQALHWFKEITGQSDVPFDDLFRDIVAVPPGSNKLLFLPYLAGERAPIWDPNARGAFVGLTMKHGLREMTRAVVESVGFAIRDIVTVMEELGLNVDEMRSTGGQVRSDRWTQIKADITGKRFLLPVVKDAELAGDLCIALFGLGRYESLADAVEATVRIERTVEPNRENRQVYDDLFAVYRESYEGLREAFGKIGRMT